MLGKHYMLTGATGSLGENIIQALNKHGAYVSIIVRNKEKANKLKAKYKNILDVYILNMNDLTQIESFIVSENIKYDGIINNAGLGYFKSNEAHTTEEIKEIYNINFINLIILINKIMPNLKRGSSIVNISSISAKVTTPYGSHYAASKAALSSFTNALRLEREDLHVLTVHPGPFKSQFHLKADPTGTFQKLTKNIQLDVDELAENIVRGMIKKKIEINEPQWMDFGLRFYQLAPRTFEKIFKKGFLSKKI
ncbi:SDR family oxidoreductase [Mammaliicoccus fleurettii]|uniref:SDR family NAD(P)-dependent oxidoreductase n=1 Tax=Mammaliicoccus fleurettii TaxID=150056 RepID=UPI000D1C306B|nr:SDR family NAD(P)-dependent oxidoreductase [Mammaliicoccus fleurettii]PTE33310.1 SDR family oxidoreductase [Mammaliicoccus fleurettii]